MAHIANRTAPTPIARRTTGSWLLLPLRLAYAAYAAGVFLACSLLVESNERGTIETPGVEAVAARVAWIRGPSHPSGPGVGLAFELRDPKQEQRALELVLSLLDDAEADHQHAAANDQED